MVFDSGLFCEHVRWHVTISSCRRFAARCDVSAATVSRVQNGHVPGLIEFVAMCNGMNVNPQQYFVKVGETKSAKQLKMFGTWTGERQ